MAVYGLRFPGNQDAPAATAVAFKFADPHLNGLPIWGPSSAGVTYMWEVEYRYPCHIGYCTTFFWANDGSFLWDAGNPNTYYGPHPWPPAGGTSPVHNWEISVEGGDQTLNGDGVAIPVVHGKRWRQALRVNGSTKEIKFYVDLPSTAAKDVISYTPAAGYGNTNPPSPALYFADAPWSPGSERLCGTLGPFKIAATLLSESIVVTELGDMSRLVTDEMKTANWLSKNSFKTVDDLADDYGSGRQFSWVGANKATRVLWSGNVGKNMLYPVAI